MPSAESYDPDTHLSLSDVALDSHIESLMVRLVLKQSKTDPYCRGMEIFMGRLGTDVCPI